MKFKKLIRRLFSEIYYSQLENWGEGDLPGLTALLLLSGLQMLNVGSILLAIQNLTLIDIFGYFNQHLVVGMLIPTVLLIMDYLIVKPITITIKENLPGRRRITWIYVLVTFLLLAGSVAWIVILNNKRGI
jgi:hypothetical protein